MPLITAAIRKVEKQKTEIFSYELCQKLAEPGWKYQCDLPAWWTQLILNFFLKELSWFLPMFIC